MGASSWVDRKYYLDLHRAFMMKSGLKLKKYIHAKMQENATNN